MGIQQNELNKTGTERTQPRFGCFLGDATSIDLPHPAACRLRRPVVGVPWKSNFMDNQKVLTTVEWKNLKICPFARWQMLSLRDFSNLCFLIAVWVSFYYSPWVAIISVLCFSFCLLQSWGGPDVRSSGLSPVIINRGWFGEVVRKIILKYPGNFTLRLTGWFGRAGVSFQMLWLIMGWWKFRLKILGNFSQAELSIRDIFPRVNCVQLTVNWWFGFLGSPSERDWYPGVPRFESQTTGPQTTNLPLADVCVCVWMSGKDSGPLAWFKPSL